MTKLKRTRTIGAIKFYRDPDHRTYFRLGDSKVRSLRLVPRRRLFRWMIGIVLFLGVAALAAYRPVMHYASNLMMEQVADKLLTKEEIDEILQMPDVQLLLRENGLPAAEDINATPSSTAPDSSASSAIDDSSDGSSANNTNKTNASDKPAPGKLRFANNDEAMKFVMKKFSMTQIREFAAMANGGLTSEEKKVIKAKVMERLTQEEFEALKILAVIELQKRNQISVQ